MDDESEEVGEDQRPGINSVEIAAHILGALAPAGRPIALKELAARAGFTTAKVHRYLVSLTRAGLVDQEPDTGFYGVGRRAVAIGLSGLWAASSSREAARAISDLRDATGETAFGAIWTDAGPVVSLLEECERPIYMNIRVGALLPLTTSAAGRVYAAHLPAALIAKAAQVQQETMAPPTHKFSNAQMKSVLDDTRRTGYAAVTSLTVEGVNAVAAPIYDYRGKVSIVIGLLGREGDLLTTPDSADVRALLAMAHAASERLGFRAGSLVRNGAAPAT